MFFVMKNKTKYQTLFHHDEETIFFISIESIISFFVYFVSFFQLIEIN